MVAGTPVILESGFGDKKIRSPVSSSGAYCVWGQPELYETKFEVSLSYMSLSQNPKENTWLTENSVHIPEVDLG